MPLPDTGRSQPRPSPGKLFLAGLASDGIVAPFVVDEPMNRAIFTQYVRQYLVPELNTGLARDPPQSVQSQRR